MTPRLRIWGACRTLAVRSRPIQPRAEPFRHNRAAIRLYSDDANTQPPRLTENASKPDAVKPADTGASAIGGVAEVSTAELASEAAQGVGATSEQSNSHIESLGDEALEQILYGGRPALSPRDGGLTPAQEEVLYRDGLIPPAAAAEGLLSQISAVEAEALSAGDMGELQKPGLKFPLPAQLPEGSHLKKRYHPVIDHVSKLIMRDGKLSVAQRHTADVMNYLRTAPAPIYSPKFPLLPGTPPASHLPLNPTLYITVAIDSVAPLIKVKHIANAGGGGRALEMPVPLALRQRRTRAFRWILEAASKKPSKGSGRKQLAHRIAEEIIAVVEGRSSAWEKRKMVHKVGTAARSHLDRNVVVKKGPK